MRLFSRRSSPAKAAAIAAFWSWWQATGAAETAAAIEAGDPGRMVESISRHVEAIHSDLAWQLAPGLQSQHVLVVGADGNAQLRAVARRWRKAAPAASAVWEYSDWRLPVPDPDGLTWT